MSRSRRAGWFFLTSIGSAAVTMLVGLWATPRLLRLLGEERYGLFRVALDWFGHLQLLEFGLGGALLGTLATAWGRGEREQVGRLLATSIRSYTRVALAMVLGAGVLVACFPLLVANETLPQTELRLSLAALAAGFLFVPLTPFRLFQESIQRGFFVNLLLVGQSLLVTALSLLAAWMGYGLVGQAVAFVAAQVPTQLALLVRGVREVPGLGARVREREHGAPAARLRALNAPTFWTTVASRISVLSDSLIVGLLGGGAAVVVLVVTQKLAQLVLTQVQSLGNAAWAGLAELHGREELPAFRARSLELTSLASTLGAAALVPVVAINSNFLALWVGAAHDGGLRMTAVAALAAYLQGVINLWGWIFTGTGEIARLVRLAAIAAALNLALSVGFTAWLGPEGPLWGTALSHAGVQLAILPRLLEETFGISAREARRRVLVPLAVGAVEAALSFRLVAAWGPLGWVPLVLVAAGLGLVALAIGAATLPGETREPAVRAGPAAAPLARRLSCCGAGATRYRPHHAPAAAGCPALLVERPLREREDERAASVAPAHRRVPTARRRGERLHPPARPWRSPRAATRSTSGPRAKAARSTRVRCGCTGSQGDSAPAASIGSAGGSTRSRDRAAWWSSTPRTRSASGR